MPNLYGVIEIPNHCAICPAPVAAGRNDVWLCARHFEEALSMMILGLMIDDAA